MDIPEPLRWLLTVALTGGALFHAARALAPRRSHEHRIAETLHAVMGVATVAMLWPFGRVVPGAAWLVVFAGSTGWFAAQASRDLPPSHRIIPVYFASAAAAMVWMCGTTAAPAMAMDMPDHGGAGRPVWATAIGGYLVAAGLGWLLSGLRLGVLPADLTDGPEAGAATAGTPEPGGSPVGSPEAGGGPLCAGPPRQERRRAHWPALCHGIMGVSMGLSMLTMI